MERRELRATLRDEGAALGRTLARQFIAEHCRFGGTMDADTPVRAADDHVARIATCAERLRAEGIDGKSIKIFWNAAVRSYVAQVRERRTLEILHDGSA